MNRDSGAAKPVHEKRREPSKTRARSSSNKALARAVLARSVSMLEPADMSSLFSSAAAAAREFLPLEACQFAVLHPDDRRADLYVATSSSTIEHRSCRSDEGLLGRALQTTDPVLMDAEQLRRHAHPIHDAALCGTRADTVVLVPLRDGNECVCGAFMCATSTREGFDGDVLGPIRIFVLQLEAALELLQARQDLRHWNTIVRASHDAIVGEDAVDRITHWSPGAERLYGHAAHEVIGDRMEVIVPDDKRAELAEVRARVARGEHVELPDTIRITRTGQRVDVSITISPVYDSTGRRIGVSSIARDITLRKQANERFRLAVESAPNAMILTDERGAIVLANAEAEELFGYSREELIGCAIEMLLPHDVREAHAGHRAAYHQSPEKRAMGAGRDLWALRKDGTRIPVEVGLNPIQEESRRSVLASIVDISERKKVEKERQRLLKEAQQAVAARDSFLSIASHELKTPLTALQLTIQALRRKAASWQKEIPADVRLVDKLDAANRQVTRLAVLIDRLLDVSRITAGRLTLDVRRVDLNEIVRDVVDRFVQGIETCAIQMPEARPIWGQWDATRIDQIFTNLLGNAVKYGEERPIDVQMVERERDVVVAVRDQGSGIAPEDQARIFERFERLVSHHHHEGFGLGLWIVRQLVEAHGGRIEVHSAPGRGSTFVVLLPKSFDESSKATTR